MSFKYILDLIKVLNWFREFDDLFLRQYGITVNSARKFDQAKLRRYDDDISRREISEEMYQLDDYKEEGVWQEYSPRVCEKFVHVADTTLIEKLAAVMKEYNVNWNTDVGILHGYNIHISQHNAHVRHRLGAYLKELEHIRYSNWYNESLTSSRSRRLSREFSLYQDIFNIDTKFIKSLIQKDLASCSFNILPDYSKKIPMNLQVNFP